MSKRAYSDEEKRRVLVVYQQKGLNATARETGVTKATILRWAQDYGVGSNALTQTEGSTRNTRAGRAGAIAKQEEVRHRLEDRAGLVLDLHQLALARELQALRGITNPTAADLRAISQARTTAMRDLEATMKMLGPQQEAGAESELVAIIKRAFALAMVDAQVPEATQDLVRIAFAHRIRMLAAGVDLPEAEVAGELETGDVDDDEAVEGEIVG